MTMVFQNVLDRARLESVENLTPMQRSHTHSYINMARIERNTKLGPVFEPVTVDRASVLVFMDPTPRADFSHACQYLLFDAESGAHYRTVQARWHPYPQGVPDSFQQFHALLSEPVPVCLQRGKEPEPAPISITAHGRRFAVLFAGLSRWRHLNEIEFCYRMLTRRYGFEPKCIQVLYFNGQLGAHDVADLAPWPGNETPYSVPVHGKGSRAAMIGALQSIGELKPEDSLFLFCTGHGDRDFKEGKGDLESSLAVVDEGFQYFASDLQKDLVAQLGKQGSLMVMMQQCHSGGFADALLKLANWERAVSFAAACSANEPTDPSDCDFWGRFAISWIAAQRGTDPLNHRLLFEVDCNGNGSVEAVEAFRYANSAGVRNPRDTPIYGHCGPRARALTLA